MEGGPMSDLDQQIERWKSGFAKKAACSSDELLELESHLREGIAALVSGGKSKQEAFSESVARLGDPTQVGSEFAKNQISNANGRARTYFKKLKRRLPIAVAVGVVLVVSIRWAIAEPFY